MIYILIWLGLGFISTLLAIYCFRRKGTTLVTGELYFAAIGPLFGPVILVLLMLDYVKRSLFY